MKTAALSLGGVTLVSLLLTGCSSSDSYSSARVSTGSSFYYGSPYPYYGYGYGDPDYVVVAPPRPDYPGSGELPVRPEQPIARPPGADRPSTLPADGPARPSTRPANSSRSRMPSAQPRMSSPRARPSIPRGGGGRRGR